MLHTDMNDNPNTAPPRRTWSDTAKHANRRRRLLRRITRRAPLLAETEYVRAVAARPDYYGEGTALPPPVRLRKVRVKPYRSRSEIVRARRSALHAQIDAFRRERGWDAVFRRLDLLRRRQMQQWAEDFPAEAARAFPLFDESITDQTTDQTTDRPDAG